MLFACRRSFLYDCEKVRLDDVLGQIVRKSALVPYKACQMYDMVYAVDLYPEFVPWCKHGEIESVEGDRVRAVLVFHRFGFSYSLRTLNISIRPSSISLSLVEGPLEHLQGQWLFESLEDGGCRVSLYLDFTMQAFWLNPIFDTLFENITQNMVEVFVKRAHSLYACSSG